MHGEIRKKTAAGALTLEQRYLTKTRRLELDRELCLGCGICAAVCPKEAVTLSDAVVAEGRLVRRPQVDIDPGRCVLCGTCVVFCPSHALRATADGEEHIPVIEHDVMPTLRRGVRVDPERCDIACELRCRDACPVEAITVETRTDGDAARITAVEVDEGRCLHCGQCEAACPLDVIRVERSFHGMVEVETGRCPEGCMACVDACPSGALQPDGEGGPSVEPAFCILCAACERVCPEGAIRVSRSAISRSEVRSGAWFKALERLTSAGVLARELAKDAARRRREVVRETFSNRLP